MYKKIQSFKQPCPKAALRPLYTKRQRISIIHVSDQLGLQLFFRVTHLVS